MTASKRPNRLSQWIDALRSYLEAHAPPDEHSFSAPPSASLPEASSDAPRAVPDGFTQVLDIWRRMPVGDRRSFAVSTCLYKLVTLRAGLSELKQRPGATFPYDVFNTNSGRTLTEDLNGIGMRELIMFPKKRWLPELHISNVLRLHRAGFTNSEIAGLLPNCEHRTPDDVRRDAKAIQGIIQKYRAAARHDLGTTPAEWPLRL